MNARLLPRLRGLCHGRNLVIGLPMVWLFVLSAAPLLIVLNISMAEMEIASVTSVWQWVDHVLTN